MLRHRLRPIAALVALVTGASIAALSGCSLSEVNEATHQLKKLSTELPHEKATGSGSAKLIYSGDHNGKGLDASTHYWGSATCLFSGDEMTMWEVPNADSSEAASDESLIGTATDTGWQVYYTKPNQTAVYTQAESDRAMTADGPVVNNANGHWTISFHGLRMQNIAGNDQFFINGDIDCG